MILWPIILKTLANIAFYNDDSVNFSNNKLTKNELIAKIQTMHQAQIKEMPDAPSVWNIDTYADTICVLPKLSQYSTVNLHFWVALILIHLVHF